MTGLSLMEVIMIADGGYKCPSCGKYIEVEEFKDEINIKEWRLSGLCQKCQDNLFNPRQMNDHGAEPAP